jgi:SHS2 domain-containing protein
MSSFGCRDMQACRIVASTRRPNGTDARSIPPTLAYAVLFVGLTTVTVTTLAKWDHFAHGADIGIRGAGSTKAAAFEQAALALTGVITDPGSVRPSVSVAIACEAPDDGVLLVDWLNALVYEMSTRRMLFGAFAVSIEGSRLTATAWGEGVDQRRHEPAVEVKGATYTALKVERLEDGGWVAQCVVDV